MLNSFKQNLNRWLFEPLVPVDADLRNRLRLLAIILLFLVAVGSVSSVAYFTLSASYGVAQEGAIFNMVAVLFLFGCYGLARFGQHYTAAWGMLGIATIGIFAIAVAAPENYLMLVYMLVPITLAGVLFSVTTMVILCGLSVVMMLALPMVFEVDMFSLLDGPIPLVSVVTAIIALALVILRQREFDLKLATIARTTDDLILVHRNGRILYVNPAGLRMLGAKSPHELIGKNFEDFVHFISVERSGTAEIFHFGQEPTLRTQEQLVRLDGQMIAVDMLTDRLIYNGQPAIQIIAKPRETHLGNAMETVYSHFVEKADEILVVCNRQGNIVYINPAGLRSSGYAMDTLTDMHFEQLLLEPMHVANGKQINTLYESGDQLEMRTSTGEMQSVEVISHLQHNNLVMLALREYHEPDTLTGEIETHFARLFNTRAFGAAITRLTDDTLINVNDAFLDMLEYKRDDVIGKRIKDLNLYQSIEDRAGIVARLRHEGSVPPTEVAFVTASGRPCTVLISMEAIEIAETPCLVAVLQDITVHRLNEQRLAESEARYRCISELMSDYVYSWRVEQDADVSLQTEWVTDAFENITGYTADEMKQMRGWALLHPEDIELRKTVVRSLLKGNAETSEFRIITKGGEMRWVRDYARPVWDEARTTITQIYGAVRDITDQIERESAIRVQALQQAIVAEIGQRALQNPTRPDVLLNDAVTLVAQVLDVQYVAILVPNDAEEYVEIHTGKGWATNIKNLCIPQEADFQEIQTLKSGETLIVDDYDASTDFTLSPLVHGTGIKSGITVSLQGHLPNVGVLAVYAYERKRFSQDDKNFLQSIANVIASYLDQQYIAHAEAQQRALAEALRDTAAVLNSTLNTDTVMERMLAHVARVVPHDGASIMLAEDDKVRIIKYRTHGKNDYPLENVTFPIGDAPNVIQMIETGQPILIQDTRNNDGWRVFSDESRWIRAYVGAPIYYQGELLGILNLDSKTPNQFTEADAQRLQAFANQAAIAIYNANRATDLEKRVAERTAQRDFEHRRTQAILDATGEGIFYTEGLIIRYVNRAFCDMIGYTPGELEGQSTAFLIQEGMTEDNATNWQTIQKALRDGAVIRSERELLRKDGTTFQAALTLSLAGKPDDSQDSLTTVTLVRDISQEKRLATQKSRFIANASHELRSPMSSLKLHFYMLKRQPERMDYHLGLLERITERMNILVEDLLDISRIEQGVIQLRRRGAILQELVGKVAEIMSANAQDKQITMTHDFDPTPLHVFADPERIDQVVTNLIANAINYTPEGGMIYISVDSFIAEHTGQAMGRVIVQDSGIGISLDDQPHVFEAFYRANTESEGTGLGLNIAREIMLLHGGDITLESIPGEGSIFTVYLPLFNS